MTRTLNILMFVLIALTLSACGTKVVYLDRYTTMIPNDSLLRDYDVPAPPIASDVYSLMSPDEKELLWITYTNDLFTAVISKHQSDKAGLRKWKTETEKETQKLNAKIAEEKK